MSSIAKTFLAFNLLFVGLFSLLYSDRAAQLLTHWTTSGDLDMGFPLFLLYLIFSTRNLRQLEAIRPHVAFILPVLLAVIALYLSQLLDIKTVFFAASLLLLATLIGLVFGWHAFQRTLMPLLIVNMAMPYWYLAVTPLQSLSALVVGNFVEAISLTALVEGNYIILPEGTIHIAGGCSGLKYFLTASALSLISSCWNHSRPTKILLSLLLAVSLAIFANWLRISILVLVGYEAGIDHPLMEDHDSLGWVVFAILLFPWCLFESRFGNEKSTSVQSDSEPTPSPSRRMASSRKTVAFGLTGLALMTLPALQLSGIQESATEVRPAFQAAENLSLATRLPSSAIDWRPNYPAPDRKLAAKYQLGRDIVDVILFEYPNQGEHEMAKTTHDIFGNDWRKVSESRWQKDDIKLRIAVAKRESRYRIIYYWYEHAGSMANSISGSKIEMLLASLRGHHQSQLYALALECPLDCQPGLQSPSEALINFIQALRLQYSD